MKVLRKKSNVVPLFQDNEEGSIELLVDRLRRAGFEACMFASWVDYVSGSTRTSPPGVITPGKLPIRWY